MDTCEQKKGTKRKVASITALVIGVLLVCAGMFSVFDNEDLNAAMVEAGAEQSVMTSIEQYPAVETYIAEAATLIEGAVNARQSSPQALIDELSKLADGAVAEGTKTVLVMLINQINAAHQTTKTEEKYLGLLSHLVTGLRKGIEEAHAKTAQQ